MVKPTIPDLKELFKQAAEIAQQVPEAMQAAAFNRAVDLLTGTAATTPAHAFQQFAKPPVAKANKVRAGGTEQAPLNLLMEHIDSTQHPGVRSSSNVLDRSLMILQIARTEHNVDGLTPGDIANILTNKFRVNTSDAAVRMALGSATNLVNRIQRGNAFIYRIMGPGEEHLAHLTKADGDAPTNREIQSIRTRRKAEKRTEKSKAPDDHKAGTTNNTPKPPKSRAENKPRKSAVSVGPKAAVLSLVDGGFFATSKTGPQVQEHLKTKRGFDFGTAQLRLVMLRLVRDGVLERDENTEGQYEYSKP